MRGQLLLADFLHQKAFLENCALLFQIQADLSILPPVLSICFICFMILVLSVDLRKVVTGLLTIIENEMQQDALSNCVFFFCNKNHKLFKIIFWNKTVFWIAQKRLEMATWPWSHTSQEAREINTDQFGNLLAGIDCIRKFN